MTAVLKNSGYDQAALVAAVKSVLPETRPLPLHEPEFIGREQEYVKDCIETGWVSSVGAYVDKFEELVAEKSGTRFAVACMNGTAALHIALVVAGVGRDDEVLVQDLTFVASANAVHHAGAIPHFVDSERETLGLDPDALDAHLSEVAELRDGGAFNRATGRRIAAVVPMHVFGHPVRMERLAEVAARWNIPVVEDAAESLGSTRNGRLMGSYGMLASVSFNGNKTITTGGGGAVVTDDESLARRLKHLTTTAKLPHRWAFDHDEIAYNYRLPNLNAALGCAQMEMLDRFLAEKRALAALYRDAVADIPEVEFFDEPEGCESNFWLNAVLVPDRAARDALLETLNADGIQARPCWTLMHELPFNRDCPRARLDVTGELVDRIVNLPSSAKLGRRS
ncbi:LegC family aminotransferase [Nisaea acidiphila]|uniref:LegC family aminotransferase n=1 Tax=Nisaea acidiphila TaxID=1862145 RepID=A0A9J7AMH9_9PROT|nr:LegC family aminotransferase [Nisaea acidiphila]UUX48375.1 LegC family aminotransferase [Nisaea acidiphila]